MKNRLLLSLNLVFISFLGFSQLDTDDCSDGFNGCDAVTNGFVIDPSGPGEIDEYNDGPNGNDISWPSPNPQGVNSGCMFSGELNSTWISFTILNDGVLEFSIGQAGGNGFFDWIMWQNTDGMACDGIFNNTLPPVSCNWNASSAGFTGMANTLPAGANSGNFQPALNVQAGDMFIICFSNFSGLTGIQVPFTNLGSAGIACSSPTTIMDPTICEGDVADLNIIGVPANTQSYSWSPATNLSDPNGGPSIQAWPTVTTTYTVTMVSPDSTWTNDVTVNVVPQITPDAGLDDSLCHSTTSGYQFNPTLSNNGNISWEYYQGPTIPGASPNSIFQPNANNINATALTNYPGLYQYVLHEEDVTGTCPEGTDTIAIYFSKETHTTTFTDPSCFGGNDGSIQIQSTGELGAVLYGFNGAAVNTASDTNNIPAGTYTVISEDYLGCSATSTVTLTDPPEVLISAGPNPDTTVCENGTATLYANATNGTTFNYHWNHTSDLNSTQTINPLGDSTVTVYAENEFGCISETLPITVLVHDPIAIDYMINDTVCPGYDATMFTTASGGFQGYTYEWTANGTAHNDSDNEINVNPLVETTYCVTVSDGCESTPKTVCADVIMREVPQPMFASDTTEGCVPTEIIFYDATTYNLAETQTDSVNWIIEGVWYTSDTVNHLFDEVGLYDVSYEIYTQYGCHNQINVAEYINIHDVPYPNIYVIPNPTTIFNTEVDMINNTDGLNNFYQWYFPGGQPATSNATAPTVFYPEGVQGDYPVQLVVTNEFNCVDSTSDVVHIISDVLIYAPNTFTPDGDQKNNTWRVFIDGIDVNQFHLLLYNRWGEVIWESYNPEGIWDGTYGGQPVQDGTYVWKIIASDYNTDKRYEFRGTVNVLR
ncbi:MAG: T9SS type B sorting domain-containing protein [Putridiphycobacter sp.]